MMAMLGFKPARKVTDNQPAHVEPVQTRTASHGELSRLPLIEARDLTKVYQTEAGGFTALKDINLQIYPGETLAVVGKSGAGKTTLLNMLSGVSEITSGEALFHTTGNEHSDGEVVSLGSLNEDQMALWRGRNHSGRLIELCQNKPLWFRTQGSLNEFLGLVNQFL